MFKVIFPKLKTDFKFPNSNFFPQLKRKKKNYFEKLEWTCENWKKGGANIEKSEENRSG